MHLLYIKTAATSLVLNLLPTAVITNGKDTQNSAATPAGLSKSATARNGVLLLAKPIICNTQCTATAILATTIQNEQVWTTGVILYPDLNRLVADIIVPLMATIAIVPIHFPATCHSGMLRTSENEAAKHTALNKT